MRAAAAGLLIAGLFIFGGATCEQSDTEMKVSKPAGGNESNARFSVERVGLFDDSLAYGNQRGIYLIRDTQTGREYLGISGIGVSELGSHQETDGKNHQTIPDER